MEAVDFFAPLAMDAIRSQAAQRFVRFLETGEAHPALFTPDVFCDFTMPRWRLQADTPAGLIALRLRGHPGPSRIVRSRADPTPRGFVFEFEERWRQGGEDWYAREIVRADLRDGAIAALSIYCTGDWSRAREEEHRAAVTLLEA